MHQLKSKFSEWRLSIIALIGRVQDKIQRRWPAFYRRFPDFWQLSRMDRPIGIYLLLWPTLWSLWMAAQGWPHWHLLIIFILGTVCMRAAGCCVNDYADRDFDGHVKRTQDRPIVTDKVRPSEALKLCAALSLLAFILVLFTNRLTILLAFAALGLALLYPFTKRLTNLAQLFLGAAYSMGVLMAFTAQTGTLPVYAWLLYVANFLWTVMYDTEYAMADREDDLKIGVKSTAILFAEGDKFVIGMLQAGFLNAMALSARHFELGVWYRVGLLIAAGLFVYQHYLIRNRDRTQCLQAFLHNHYVGLVIFLFTVIDLAAR